MSPTGPTPPSPRCRFYGMQALPEFRRLFTGRGNQCGLLVESCSPCRMEEAGLEVDFEKCEFKESGRAAEFADFKWIELVPARRPAVTYHGDPRKDITLRFMLDQGLLVLQFQPANDRLPAVLVLQFPNGQQTTVNAETGQIVSTIYPPVKPTVEPQVEQRRAHGPRTRP